MTVSRRGWLRSVLQGIGIGALRQGRDPGGRRPSSGRDWTGERSAHGAGHAAVRRRNPGARVHLLVDPNERFFVRSHFGPPAAEAVQPETWRLTVKGLVKEGLSLSLKDLHAFESVTVTAVLQCSGNGARTIAPRCRACNGSAVRSGTRSGPARLRDVLERAGVKPQGVHVQMQGADRPALPTVPLFTRSIPIARRFIPIRSSPLK